MPQRSASSLKDCASARASGLLVLTTSAKVLMAFMGTCSGYSRSACRFLFVWQHATFSGFSLSREGIHGCHLSRLWGIRECEQRRRLGVAFRKMRPFLGGSWLELWHLG